MTFGKYLKRKREEAGLSQAELAKGLGYSNCQFISNIERSVRTRIGGPIAYPPKDKINKLAKCLKVSPDEIKNEIIAAKCEEIQREWK